MSTDPSYRCQLVVAGEGKSRYGRATLQEGLKKAFQHLQSNQKNYRREIHPAHGRENAPDRLQQRFGKPVYKPDRPDCHMGVGTTRV